MSFRITKLTKPETGLDWALELMENQSDVVTSKRINDVQIELRKFSLITPGEHLLLNRKEWYFVVYSQTHGEYNEYINGVLWAQPAQSFKSIINDYTDCCCHFSNKEE